jgi:hypothetical protein
VTKVRSRANRSAAIPYLLNQHLGGFRSACVLKANIKNAADRFGKTKDRIGSLMDKDEMLAENLTTCVKVGWRFG